MTVITRRSYDCAASGQTQANLAGLCGQLEAVLDDRDRQVRAAMSDFQADGVSDAYQAKELRWRTAAAEVRQILALLRSALERNDGVAAQALAQARSAVEGI